MVGLARTAPDLTTVGRDYAHLSCDASDLDSIPGICRRITGEHGTPFALANNSDVGTDGLLPTLHNSDITKLPAVNLNAPILPTKYLCRTMLAARSGRIVNVSSIVARTGYRGLSVYAATKAGLEGFTRSLARDLGPRGVTVNCVAPGFLDTEMTEVLGAANREPIRRHAALGRFPSREEVAAAVR